MRKTLFSLLVLVLALPGCQIREGDDGPTAPSSADLTITVVPNPLRLLVTCPPGNAYCFGSLDATVTLQETAGVGGRVEYCDVAIRNVTLSRTETTVRLAAEWFRAQAGTDRIEANGRLSVRPVVEGYPWLAGARPVIEILLDLQFQDDRGNTVRESLRVPVT
ncbi:MAG TPA: hypothetical protein VFM29_01410 [Vicinamibacteria bacterium]|nr:hypothetical protein [Vicinamibacteria bacterium]